VSARAGAAAAAKVAMAAAAMISVFIVFLHMVLGRIAPAEGDLNGLRGLAEALRLSAWRYTVARRLKLC
jgi:hypothetical protein